MPNKKLKTGEIDWEHLWAEVIYRKQLADKECLFAYVRKKFNDEDIVMDGAGQWIGLVEEPIYKMITDNDENSDTFGTRVPDKNVIHYQDGHTEEIPIKKGTRFKYTFTATPETIKNFKKLVGVNQAGDTKFIWSFSGGREISCPYPDEFWDVPIREVRDHDLRNQRVRADKGNEV